MPSPCQRASIATDPAARQAAETRTQGYLRSILSSQRHLLTERLDDEHADLAAARVPVLAIWGAADRLLPKRALGDLARVNREARHVTVPGAGHALVHTHPREVAAAIQAFPRES